MAATVQDKIAEVLKVDVPSEEYIQNKKTLADAWYSEKAIKIGDVLPSFSLPNALGETVTTAELLKDGPIVISFYRGGWCPICNVELQALQENVQNFKAKGVTLVAISPELPNKSLNTKQKAGLDFAVLSDVDNKYAKELGIVYGQHENMKALFDDEDYFGVEFGVKTYGDENFGLPIPATFLVDRKGIVRNAFIEPDYFERVEPEEVLGWIDALEASGSMFGDASGNV